MISIPAESLWLSNWISRNKRTSFHPTIPATRTDVSFVTSHTRFIQQQLKRTKPNTFSHKRISRIPKKARPVNPSIRTRSELFNERVQAACNKYPRIGARAQPASMLGVTRNSKRRSASAIGPALCIMIFRSSCCCSAAKPRTDGRLCYRIFRFQVNFSARIML